MLEDKNCTYLNGDGEECKLDASAKKNIKTKQKEFAKKGLRTLLMAYKKNIGDLSSYTGEKHPAHKLLTNVENYTEIESNPTIVGIVGILDPARPEVAHSIKMC
jgi:magnesium-transporting ATPase (P-type)